MTKELLLLKGIVANLPPENQAKIKECIDKANQLLTEYGQDGLIALQIVLCEEVERIR